MVAFGSSLREARRQGWEAAYLDYDRLKSILEEMDNKNVEYNKNNNNDDDNLGGSSTNLTKLLLSDDMITSVMAEESSSSNNNETNDITDRTSMASIEEQQNNDNNRKGKDDDNNNNNNIYYAWNQFVRSCHQFIAILHLEIEKVSLFTLTRQGELADTIGRIRFPITNTNTTRRITDLVDSSSSSINTSTNENNTTLFQGKQLSMKSEILDQNRTTTTTTTTTITKYCTLGVELLHLLRFICVNATGVRKILKKHDKLLHRLFMKKTGSGRDLYVRSNRSHNKFDTNNNNNHHQSQPFLLQEENNIYMDDFRLVESTNYNNDAVTSTPRTSTSTTMLSASGPGDHLQQLANSASVSAIHASLRTALIIELKKAVSTSASSTTNQTFQNNDKNETTTGISSITSIEDLVMEMENISFSQFSELNDNNNDKKLFLSIYRLKVIMDSIQILRENAFIVNQPFSTFLSRQAMIMTGTNLGGIEGAPLQALEFLLDFEPDRLLTLNHKELVLWHQSFFLRSNRGTKKSYHHDFMLPIVSDEDHSQTSKAPTSSDAETSSLDERRSHNGMMMMMVRKRWGGVDSISMGINLMSTLLYTVNYYIVAPTANHYAILLGTDGAFGATLVGASSLAALFSAVIYSFWYTKSSFKSILLFSSICPLIGNLLYSLAISYNSMTIAFWGRILAGFGSAEVVNRQLISACVSFRSMTRACAYFVAAGALGMSIGPLLAAILDDISGRDTKVDLTLPFMPEGGIIYDHVTSPGFCMAGLWFLQVLAVIFMFSEPERINGDVEEGDDDDADEERGIGDYASNNSHGIVRSLSKSSSSTYDNGEDNGGGEQMVILKDVSRACGDKSPDAENTTMYGALPSLNSDPSSTISDKKSLIDGKTVNGHSTIWQAVVREITSTAKLVFANPSLPVTLLLFAYIEFADEVLISSCSMVCRRYFGWHGSRAGFLIASLGALVLPAHFVVERASRHYSERRIMKYSILFIILSLVAIFNYGAIYYDVVGISKQIINNDSNIKNVKHIVINGKKVKKILNKNKEFPYDGKTIGPFVYVASLSAVFMGTIILEGVDTSLMAKVTPSQLNNNFINSGLLATLVGTLGRVLGDGTITASALIDIHIFVDFVNATFFPVLILAIGGYYLTNNHYSRLI